MSLGQLEINVVHHPSADHLQTLGVEQWPIWSKEASEFPWYYDESETCYFLEGEVTVIPANGQPVRVGKGDLVTFPAGLSCTWQIHEAVRKHYQFEG